MLVDIKWSRQHKDIPKILHLTYNNKTIPKYVIDKIQANFQDYDIRFYDDSDCIKYLKDKIGDYAVRRFNSLKLGAHKADLFRYAVLYIEGGLYIDIKTKLLDNQVFVTNLVNRWSETSKDHIKTFLTVLANNKKSIYQGIIMTPPGNPVIKEQLLFVLLNNPKQYDHYVSNFYKTLQRDIIGNFISKTGGIHKLSNGWSVYLYYETCVKGNDRYGVNCKIYDNSGHTICGTRYHDFPWKTNINQK